MEPTGMDQYERLFSSLDRCLTLGCVCRGVDTLLSSAFFDPTLPYNIVGAQWRGIRRALDLDNNNFSPLINALINRPRELLYFGLELSQFSRPDH